MIADGSRSDGPVCLIWTGMPSAQGQRTGQVKEAVIVLTWAPGYLAQVLLIDRYFQSHRRWGNVRMQVEKTFQGPGSFLNVEVVFLLLSFKSLLESITKPRGLRPFKLPFFQCPLSFLTLSLNTNHWPFPLTRSSEEDFPFFSFPACGFLSYTQHHHPHTSHLIKLGIPGERNRDLLSTWAAFRSALPGTAAGWEQELRNVFWMDGKTFGCIQGRRGNRSVRCTSSVSMGITGVGKAK